MEKLEKMKPLGDKVLVKRSELESKTAGGIFIPDTAKDEAQHGTVISVGPGRVTHEGKTIPLSVKTGATVYFGKYSGTKFDNDYLIMREEEILGVIEQE